MTLWGYIPEYPLIRSTNPQRSHVEYLESVPFLVQHYTALKVNSVPPANQLGGATTSEMATLFNYNTNTNFVITT